MSSPPVPLEKGLIELLSGGGNDWRDLPPIKDYTNAFIWSDEMGKMLLGYKKRGFGKGIYNGFGGKVEPGETPIQAAKRELLEESGVQADLEHCGNLYFVCEGLPFTYNIHVFRANVWEGDPIETDEMRPKWFALPDKNGNIKAEDSCLDPLPYSDMWKDDYLWMPLMLSRTPFVGRVDFAQQAEGEPEKDQVFERWWFGKIA